MSDSHGGLPGRPGGSDAKAVASPEPPVSLNRSMLKAISGNIANIAAVVALVISGLTFWTSYQANRNAMLARQATELTRYAGKVAYWVNGSGDNSQVVVQNLSDQPILNVMVYARTVSNEGAYVGAGYATEVGLATSIGPCKVMTANIINAARLYFVGYGRGAESFGYGTGPIGVNGYGSGASFAGAERMARYFEKVNGFRISIGPLIFTDESGRQWVRVNGGYFGKSLEAFRYFPGITPYLGTAPIHPKVTDASCS
jgi:hypothetical protein